ncbi:MAG: hypothetical protein OXC05_10035 [Halieaceae bacterium]|nr:hypothetical protein [Halieaceae bacterium]
MLGMEWVQLADCAVVELVKATALDVQVRDQLKRDFGAIQVKINSPSERYLTHWPLMLEAFLPEWHGK